MSSPRRSNRPFWAIVIVLAIASVGLVALIYAYRPTVVRGQEVLARENLMRAEEAARIIAAEYGTFDAAEPRLLADLLPGILFIDPDQSSNEPEILSVYATDEVWAAAAGPTTGGCQWIRVDAAGAVSRGTGTDCSGEEAATAPAADWPSD